MKYRFLPNHRMSLFLLPLLLESSCQICFHKMPGDFTIAGEQMEFAQDRIIS
jgi:hypothetical protein